MPRSLAFGNQAVGATSLPRTVTLTNTGNATLSISSIAALGDNGSGFAETNDCGSSLNAGLSCTITVTFAPQLTGNFSSPMLVTDNATGSPQIVTLGGTGTTAGPVATFSFTSLTFPLLVLGATSPSQTVTLTNTGSSSLTLASVSISGTDETDFGFSNACGSLVGPGGSCSVDVTFTPLADGTRTASLNFTDDAPGSPQAITLTGSGGFTPPPDPLGTVTHSSSVSCPGGSLPGSCTQLSISCPNLPSVNATIKVTPPKGAPVGTVIFLAGGGGGALYESEWPYGSIPITAVGKAGYTAVQVVFQQFQDGWLEGPAINGPRATACRPATVFQWVYTNVHQGGTSKPMCGTGNSGGAGALGYALSHYGLDNIFAMVEPTSGPPMGRVDTGCLCNQPNVESFCASGIINQCYGANAGEFIDPSYGNSDCSNHLMSESSLWLTDSVASPDANYSYPQTLVHVLYGGLDTGPSPALAEEWVNALTGNKLVECVLDAPHDMPDALDAANKIGTDLTSECTLPTGAPANGQ